jgi:nucleotide-binding universal stress UspA family protein
MAGAQSETDVRGAFSRIAVACERGSGLLTLARFALLFAANNATVRLIDIVSNPASLFPTLMLSYPDWSEAHRAMTRAASTMLKQTSDELARAGISADTQLLDSPALHVDTAALLGRAVKSWQADLVAISSPSRKHHWACHFNPEEVAASTHCPVLYVPNAQLSAEIPRRARVLILVDGTRASLQMLRAALLSVPANAELKVAYVIDGLFHLRKWCPRDLLCYQGERALDAAAAVLREHGVDARTTLLETETELDDVPDAISREARQWKADAIVMGLRSRRALSETLPGRVVSRALRDPPCAVVVYPPAWVAAKLAQHVDDAPVAIGTDPPPVFL